MFGTWDQQVQIHSTPCLEPGISSSQPTRDHVWNVGLPAPDLQELIFYPWDRRLPTLRRLYSGLGIAGPPANLDYLATPIVASN